MGSIRYWKGQEFEYKHVVVGDEELGVATRKLQAPGKGETPRTNVMTLAEMPNKGDIQPVESTSSR